ncbi:hypothetical protein Acr_05g0016040 [Actinidia rufa]|uniref:Uncharacterized protein n=1 Tax=Actinidia rufa TaxID=165716 RepID=A0A7J0EN88_9ERIC|nr:hypothetical protein Acr_05g0016040 [Actinidia rufa]
MRVRHGKMLSPNPGEETHESRKDNQLLCRDESGSATRMSGDRMACGNTRQVILHKQETTVEIQKEDDYRGALSKVKRLDKLAGIPFRFPHYKLTPTIGAVYGKSTIDIYKIHLERALQALPAPCSPRRRFYVEHPAHMTSISIDPAHAN